MSSTPRDPAADAASESGGAPRAEAPAARSDSPYLKTVIDLLNPPLFADNCPKGTDTK